MATGTVRNLITASLKRLGVFPAKLAGRSGGCRHASTIDRNLVN
jgi:hypothetical protein